LLSFRVAEIQNAGFQSGFFFGIYKIFLKNI